MDASNWRVLRHFSALVLFLRLAFLRALRELSVEYPSPAVKTIVEDIESLDEMAFVFIFCEMWKAIAFLATSDPRYLRYRDTDEDEVEDLNG